MEEGRMEDGGRKERGRREGGERGRREGKGREVILNTKPKNSQCRNSDSVLS